MPPAGRPRNSENRDLSVGVYRRVRGGRVRYYDASGRALGTDKARAALLVAQRVVAAADAPQDTWQAASRMYRDWMQTSDLSKHTRANYSKCLTVLDAVFGALRLDEIRPLHIGQILRETTATPSWGNHLVIVVSVVWRKALAWGLTERPSPTTGLEKHKLRPRDRHLTDEEVALIYHHGDQVLRDWLALEMVAGQRVSDTLSLRREHIAGNELRPPNTKTGKPVRIAIDGDLKRVLDDLLSRPRKVSGPWLIQTPTGKPVSYWMLDRRWREALRKARAERPDMPPAQMRDLRAKSATDAPETAQARLGHTTSRMTDKHYIRSVPLAGGGKLPKGWGK